MPTIRNCGAADLAAIHAIVNDAARAYRGHIPADRWHEPYMPEQELRQEIEAGVVFWGWEDDQQLRGVMGLQEVADVVLIRHAYVATTAQRQGIGGELLEFLRARTSRPLLVGTWAAATWAVRFYEQHRFRLVSPAEKERLLRRYWTVPDRQIETSVVLADPKWPAPRHAGNADGG